jgi:transcriptional regulator with XRE-family HTH domain
MTQKIPTNMKVARIKRGLRQSDVATAVGVTQATYSRMENGVTRPDYENLARISGVLGVSVNRLTLTTR